MDTEQILIFLEVSNEDLSELSNGRSIKNYQFVEKQIFSHSNGIFANTVIFSVDGEYYKFLEVSYGEVTYTKPYKVFLTETTYTSKTYSNWVDVEYSQEDGDYDRDSGEF